MRDSAYATTTMQRFESRMVFSVIDSGDLRSCGF